MLVRNTYSACQLTNCAIVNNWFRIKTLVHVPVENQGYLSPETWESNLQTTMCFFALWNRSLYIYLRPIPLYLFLYLLVRTMLLKGQCRYFDQGPRGPEIALTFLRIELIVELQNSQMGFKMTRLLFKITYLLF